jgi:hypothetical protein
MKSVTGFHFLYGSELYILLFISRNVFHLLLIFFHQSSLWLMLYCHMIKLYTVPELNKFEPLCVSRLMMVLYNLNSGNSVLSKICISVCCTVG